MQNISIKRYNKPENIGFWGWVEPKDKSWIVFIDLDNVPHLFKERDYVGAIIN